MNANQNETNKRKSIDYSSEVSITVTLSLGYVEHFVHVHVPLRVICSPEKDRRCQKEAD